MGERLRVGIIGLGRQWRRRYAPALEALSDSFEVAGVCDQIAQQAASEAARLHCPAAAGPSELLERDDVDAVLLLDLGWQRLWPVERAARLGKPVFCLPALEDDANADAVAEQVQQAGLPVVIACPTSLTPAVQRLADLQSRLLGPVRLLVGELARQARYPSSGLLAWLLALLGTPPQAVIAAGSDAGGLLSITIEAVDGRCLQLTSWNVARPRSPLRLHVIGANGQATVEGSRRLSWCDSHGEHVLTLPRGRPVEQLLLARFHGVVTEGQPASPSLGEAHRALRCLRAASQSRAEGCRITL
jgi:predicted dehydrogenase